MKRIFLFVVLLAFFYSARPQIIKHQMPDKLVVLSFDDAPLSQYVNVAPLLKKYGFNATFFVCEFPSQFRDSLYMSWAQIKELDKMGFEIANHTRTHMKVSKFPPSQLTDELTYIENKCDSMGIDKPVSFAYPGYDITPDALVVLKDNGYLLARAGGRRAYDPATDHPLLIPSWATKATNKEEIMAAFAEAKPGKVVVLTIHGVPDIEHPWVNTPPELFAEYLQYLSENQFKVISMVDLLKYIDAKAASVQIVPDLTKTLKN